MKKISCLAVLILSLCTLSLMAQQKGDANVAFDRFKEDFVKDMWRIYPAWASSVGYHKFDSLLLIPDAQSRDAEMSFCQQKLRTLQSFHIDALNEANLIDRSIIENQLMGAMWAVKELKQYEWDPTIYNVSGGFAELLADEKKPINARIRTFAARMTLIPAYYNAAKQNIKNPTLEHTALAIEQCQGGLDVFEKDLEETLKKCTLPAAEKEMVKAKVKKAVESIKNFTDWLKKLDNKNPRSFRLGEKLYAQKLAFDLQTGYSVQELFSKAMRYKIDLQLKMYELTEKLWPKYFKDKTMPTGKLIAVKEMIDRLSQEHVSADSFQSEISRQIPLLERFIAKHDLIDIDASKPLVVRPEPAYMAGIAGASINAPGPYDKDGNTYYNVGSLKGWDAGKAEGYLKEYNHYILPILNIHEAIPGHYTQLVYANRSPSIIKSIFGNNAMIEGWAVYTERMMLENGFDIDNLDNNGEASPEMWLMYYKWHLRSVCNTIIDISVHTRNMTEDEVMRMLEQEAFQQKTEGMNKWRRVQLTQVQLCCYFAGYSEIFELRESYKKLKGKKFDLKQFHESFLSYGSAPVKFIRQAMMQPGQ